MIHQLLCFQMGCLLVKPDNFHRIALKLNVKYSRIMNYKCNSEKIIGLDLIKMLKNIKSDKFNSNSFVQRKFPLFLQPVYKQARMAELVDALDSKSSDSNIVPVRFRLRVRTTKAADFQRLLSFVGFR